jgi:hypothetical protein
MIPFDRLSGVFGCLDLSFRLACRPRGFGFERLGAGGANSIRIEERRRPVGAIRAGKFQTRLDRPRSAFGRLGLGFERLRQRGSIISGELCRHIAFRHSDGVDLLAQHAKTAIAQKFALTAEHRRGGQRDQPAPIKPRQGPLETDAGKRFPLANHADQLVAAIQSDAAEESLKRLAAVGRIGPHRGDEHRMRRAKAALLVESPEEARVR